MLLSILLIAQVAAVAPTPTPAPVTLTSTPLPQAGGGSISSVAGTVKIDRAKADVIFQQDAKAETSPLVSLPEPTAPPPATVNLPRHPETKLAGANGPHISGRPLRTLRPT